MRRIVQATQGDWGSLPGGECGFAPMWKATFPLPHHWRERMKVRAPFSLTVARTHRATRPPHPYPLLRKFETPVCSRPSPQLSPVPEVARARGPRFPSSSDERSSWAVAGVMPERDGVGSRLDNRDGVPGDPQSLRETPMLCLQSASADLDRLSRGIHSPVIGASRPALNLSAVLRAATPLSQWTSSIFRPFARW